MSDEPRIQAAVSIDGNLIITVDKGMMEPPNEPLNEIVRDVLAVAKAVHSDYQDSDRFHLVFKAAIQVLYSHNTNFNWS